MPIVPTPLLKLKTSAARMRVIAATVAGPIRNSPNPKGPLYKPTPKPPPGKPLKLWLTEEAARLGITRHNLESRLSRYRTTGGRRGTPMPEVIRVNARRIYVVERQLSHGLNVNPSKQ